ncbi:MAG: pili assembly chaperone [Idiomarina sp.]|nr:MAG: pili assembly chaperone [Idiomarina sp.]
MVRRAGFTLIEIVIAIVVLAVSLLVLTTLIFPQARNSTEQVFQARAIELGNSLINEIMARGFDENSDISGGIVRCGEFTQPDCTAPTNLGPEAGETRPDFDDVDDYHLLHLTEPNIESALGVDITDEYIGFSYVIEVCYATLQGECVGSIQDVKRITVTIESPNNDTVTMSSLRGNF